MELGATVCSPKAPLCAECPVRPHCWAQRRVGPGPAHAEDSGLRVVEGAALPQASFMALGKSLCLVGSFPSLPNGAATC